jgi:hypothetical protein
LKRSEGREKEGGRGRGEEGGRRRRNYSFPKSPKQREGDERTR